MATIQSLGLHEPCGIAYLVTEGILPPDPSPSLYRWQTYQAPAEDGSGLVTEEILIALSTVVWSRGGIVKRVFNLSVEDEPVSHAFIADFQGNDTGLTSSTGRQLNTSSQRGLVVILRNQAHIYFLSGDTHVLPLSFEVDAAFPCPYGFILQRKIKAGQKLDSTSSNSFNYDLSIINESLDTIKEFSGRPSLVLPDVTETHNQEPKTLQQLPRTFSFTDTISELGLVVCSTSTKPQSFDDCQALPQSERILYISSHDELHSIEDAHDPLCVAVSVDDLGSKFTIWHVAKEVPLDQDKESRKRTSSIKEKASRRKSSNIYGRSHGAATPVSRVTGQFHESIGIFSQQYPESVPPSSNVEQKSFGADDLANQLGPEFGDVGVQTRSARRVSSMLARTDLGAGNDRNTFNELAMGHGNRRSLNRSTRRGESIGSFGDRQSFGFRRRSSFPTNGSILSNTTSFLDVPGHGHLVDADLSYLHNGTEFEDLAETESNLPREVGFFKIKSFSRSDQSKSGSSKNAFNVSTLLSPIHSADDTHVRREISVCVMDSAANEMVITNILLKFKHSKDEVRNHLPNFTLKATALRRGSGIADGTVVVQDRIRRLLILSKSRTGHYSLQLESPWSMPFRVELPSSFTHFSPLGLETLSSPDRKKETGSKRILDSAKIEPCQLQGIDDQGCVLLTDSASQSHLLSFRLAPRDPFIHKILVVSDAVFGSEFQDSLLLAFWEVSRWIKEEEMSHASEWTILIIVLFVLAVPFIDHKSGKSPAQQRRKKGGLLRSSSGTVVDLSCWDAMQDQNRTALLQMNTVQKAWSRLCHPQQTSLASNQKTGHSRSQSLQTTSQTSPDKKSSFLLQCTGWARDFVQSPAGETAIGLEGYLPIAINKDRQLRSTALAKILVGLHLLYEEKKLDIWTRGQSHGTEEQMIAVMAQLGQWLGWSNWTLEEDGHYINEATEDNQYQIEETRMTGLDLPAEPFYPPSILKSIDDCITKDQQFEFPTLAVVMNQPNRIDINKNTASIQRLTPRTYALMSFMGNQQYECSPKTFYHNMLRNRIKKSVLETLPIGIAAAFYQAITVQRNTQGFGKDTVIENPAIVDRKLESDRMVSKSIGPLIHDATKDYHIIVASALEADSLQRWDASSEADRHVITRMIFKDDRRFQEASKLVNQTRPPIVECTPEPDWTEADLLEAQKELAQFVTRRTLSVAAGRGMIHFNARVPLLTERVPIPAFSLQSIIKPRNATESTQSMTFSADKAAFTEDKVCWAFFHNGASAGLMISKDAKCIDTSWILYNKPPELTNRHAGFLLALGLNGHLKNLAKWVSFKYLTPKHTMTSIGLLLGLSVSYLGTMDSRIVRLLSVHVTRLLPPGAAELNLSPLTQTTGIMGIGLLYYNSQHRRMSEVMLSEIENNDSEEGAAEDSLLRDESYRLAAGFSLGLINLGHGKRLHSLHDMAVVERLLKIAVGTKNVNLVHVLDRATAGAVLAIAFLFLKTNDEAVARKIDIPNTTHQFDYVRPDIFLLRTLARHLIMWDSINPTQGFIKTSLPTRYRPRVSLRTTKHLSTEDMPFLNIVAGICFAIGLRFAGTQRHDVRDILISYLDQFLRLSRLPALNYDARVALNSVRNCLDLLALSTATVMAGSGDLHVMRRMRSLHGRTDKDTPFGSHLAAHMALGALFLGGGTRTFGTSNLAIASLCIAFYPLFPNDVLDNRGHLQALRHLWVLAVEGRCLIARSAEDGGNVISGVKGIIQLKNGQSQTVQAPGLLPDFNSIESIEIYGEGYWDVYVDFTNPDTLKKAINEQTVNVTMHRRSAYDKPSNDDTLTAELADLEDANVCGIPSINPNLAARTMQPSSGSVTAGSGNPFEWLFDLNSLKDHDYAEKALVLSQGFDTESTLLETTVVDTRLELEHGILPVSTATANPDTISAPHDTTNAISRTDLFQIKLLFSWCDKWDRDDEKTTKKFKEELATAADVDDIDDINPAKWSDGTYLRRAVIDRLRWRIWKMSSTSASVGDDELEDEDRHREKTVSGS